MELLDKKNQDLMVMATFVVCGALQQIAGLRHRVSPKRRDYSPEGPSVLVVLICIGNESDIDPHSGSQEGPWNAKMGQQRAPDPPRATPKPPGTPLSPLPGALFFLGGRGHGTERGAPFLKKTNAAPKTGVSRKNAPRLDGKPIFRRGAFKLKKKRPGNPPGGG